MRKNRASLNLSGTRQQKSPSPSRVIDRPPRERPVKKPRLEVNEHTPISEDITNCLPEENDSFEMYQREMGTKQYLVGSYSDDSSVVVALPHCSPEGSVLKGRRLQYHICVLRRVGERSELSMVGRCCCDKARSNRIETYPHDLLPIHSNNLQTEECTHLRYSRTLPLVESWLIEERGVGEERGEGEESGNGNITQFCDSPVMYLVGSRRGFGVVKVTNMKCTCIVCHSEKCHHVNKLNGEKKDDLSDHRKMMDLEEEEGTIVPRFTSIPIASCLHGIKLQSMEREIVLITDKGIRSTIVIISMRNLCCSFIRYESPIVLISEKFAIDQDLLIEYESQFTRCATSLNGFWSAKEEFLIRTKRDPTKLLSLSSMKRGWNEYLSHLEIPSDGFICSLCGLYPEAIITDCITLGTRSDLASFDVSSSTYVFDSHNPGWYGKREMRKQLREFAAKGTEIDCLVVVPLSGRSLVDDATLQDGSVDRRFTPIFSFLFADSPIPDILRCGINGSSRALIDSIVHETIDWNELETHHQLAQDFPLLMEALLPFRDEKMPRGILNVLIDFIHIIDSLYRIPKSPNIFYESSIESLLDFYPNWPMKRGRGTYKKDGRRDNMICSRKETEQHHRLSPGILLMTCPHRVVYGFTILKSCESPRHVFDVLVTRMDDGEMPRIVIYDNACHLSAYCLAREPARFRNTRMLIDRFHSVNHLTCSRSLHLREYKSNTYLSSLNSQSCEQTNARLRDIGNVLPFMGVDRYSKALKLFLWRNQPRK